MQKRSFHLEVVPADKGKRLDKYLVENLPREHSRAHLQRLISDGHVLVNKNPAKNNHRILPGETIDVVIPAPVKSRIEPEKIKLRILHEDKNLLVVNKPTDMVVHPAPGSRTHTLVNALLAHCKNLSGIGGVMKPGIVHRIDKDVSGLLVVAKTDRAHRALAEQFKDKTASRIYYAVVQGVIELDNGIIDLPIGRSKSDRKKMAVSFENSKEALTRYKVVERLKDATLLEITLGTGRTHQIRVHLAYIGYPIMGDVKYGGNSAIFSRPALHARTLGFIHPITGKKVRFTTDLPRDMKELIKRLKGPKSA